MTTTRNRIGPQQAAILALLSNGEPWITTDISFRLHGEPLMLSQAVGMSSIRRSLALLRRKGLVSNGGTSGWDREHYSNWQGQPTVWRITDAGREYLTRRDDTSKAGTPAREDT